MNELKIPRINESIYHDRLENGLDVFLYPKDELEKTFAIFSTKYGSIDQKFIPLNGQEMVTVPDGIAHFLEHKMFEKEDGDVFQHFSERGASANAFTSFTQTAYLFSSTSDVKENVETLLDFVQDPYFTEESVEKEKGIIEQEIRMYDDKADWRLFFGTLGAMFEKHPVHIDIAGTVESINKITHEDLYTCYETFYHPSNMQLFIIGNFDLNEIETLVRDNQNNKSFEDQKEIERDYGDEPVQVHKQEEVIKMPISTPKCMVAIKEKPEALQQDLLLENDLVRDIVLDLYFSKSGRYFEELYQEGLTIDTLRLEFVLEESFGFTAVGANTMEPEKFSKRVKEMFLQIKDEEIDEKEFDRAKKKKYGELIREFNDIEGTANNFMQYNQMGLDFRDIFETLENLTLDRFKDNLSKWVSEEQIAICMVVPEGE
ncbi:EF-P 5-aminopentanol modification-associated protein YfmH [Alkalibacillus haloalkaliphilus]|uniref:Peptidase M16 n=1 Tax=Alkalibacillus haloalkaliphilus TaxID=94136 RepID=A0A511W1L0_9BACI|nr:pitrilysin family protein [Alkalibacillus haloalkaliphilus]GEN44980.1 peptidase M16 [Alkalibacillus haloalkaliphilus]